MIKLTDILNESETISDLKKIESSIKKKLGSKVTTTFATNKRKRGPKSYEKNHPILIINKGIRNKEISVTIGGDYEIEYGWEITGPDFEFNSFKSWDDVGIVKYILKKLN